MSVHYKFKSALDFDTISFDSLHISVADLKKAIIHQKRLGKTHDFDLQITNAQTKEEYAEDTCLIPKNTSLIIARIPLTTQNKRQWEPPNQQQQIERPTHQPGIENANLDLSRMNGSEEEKIAAMMKQSTMEYDPENYQKVRNSSQQGEVPPNYRCHRCNKSGHWIKNCPLNALGKDPHYSHHNKFKGDGQKKMTGIPRSFINQQQQQQVQEQPQPTPVGEQKQKIPEELICSICEDLFTDAVMTPCCGMSFCDECVRTALLESEDNQCPDCKEKGTSPGSLIPNRFLRNNVNSFRNETGYSKVSQPKLPPVEEPEETAEQIVENPDTTEENLEQSGETTENIVESSENYPAEAELEAECQEENAVDEGEGLEDPNFDVENENDFDDETEHVLADGQEPIEEEFRDYDERDQTSDDEDNITVTVPPAHMQVRGANFRSGRHRMRDQHVESYNQNQNPDTNSNTPTFDEKEAHSEENVDYKYRHQKKPHHSSQSQIPSVSGSYRNNEEMGGNVNQQQNYPPNSNSQGIPNNEMQSQQEMYHQNPNPNVYHQQQGPVHHSQQPQQMHGPTGHYPPQQPYGGQPYGAPMGMRPMRYDPHGYNRHPGPPHHMVRGGYHGHDQYMARQRHLAPSLSAAAREVQQTFGTGIIEDPLEAFNRIMREKEIQKKREKERRRSPDRDRRSHSFDRKRSPAYSPENHRKSPPDRGRSEERDRERERDRRRHRSSSYNSDSSRSFSRSRSRSRKRNAARRRSRSRSHSPQRYPRRRENYPKDHYRDDRHRSPDRYSRNRGGYRGRGGRGYYNRNYENRSGDNYNQQNYPHHMKQNDYQGYPGQHVQQAPPMAQQSYMEGYVPYEADPRQMAIKPTNVVDPTAMIQNHPYEVQVHTMEEQPPPPGYETSPKDDDSVNKPLITSNQMDESNPKNDSFDSTANLPDTTDRKYLSEDENVAKNNKGRRSNSVEKNKDKERTKDSSKIDHKKSHSRHHHSEKRRDRERDRDRDKEKERDSSTDDGKRDKKSKDKKKRKKSKETEKKKNKKERKEKDKEKDKDKDKKDKEHHHHHKEKRVGGTEDDKDLKKTETVESAGDDKGLSTTVSNTNENSMEAIDSEQVPSSTTTKDIQEHFDDTTTNTPEHLSLTPTKDTKELEISAVESSDQKDQQSPIHFNRSDSVLDIYTNLDFEGELEDEVEQQSPQKSELPELSKWERDEDNQVTSVEKISQQVEDANVSGNEKSSDEKVTSEVLKRAENAIFARAINAIKPLETKKSSTDRERQKQYSSSSNSESNKETLPGIVSHKKSESSIMDFKTETVQITVPANEENPSRSVEIKTDVSQKKNSPIRSVKDRLGSKIVEKKRSRSRTRSRTPKRKLMSTTGRSTIGQRKRSISRSRSRERGRGRDDRRNDRGKPYDRPRDIGGRGGVGGGDLKRGQDIMRSTIRHSSKDRTQYDRRQRSRNRSRDRQSRSRDKRTTNRRSRSPQGPPPSSTNEESRAKKRNTDENKTDDTTKKTSEKSSTSVDASAKTAKKSKEDSSAVKKRHRSPSSTSSRSDSDSSSSSDSDDSKHHKKHGKKTKKKNRASSTESQASASKRKKLKKNKKSVKKKKKSKK